MKKIITTLLTGLITISFVFGQSEIVVTKSGKKVILNPDGTWKYADAKKDIQQETTTNDCSQYIQTVEDKMTGDKFISAKKTLLVSTDAGKTGFRIILIHNYNRTLIFHINAEGAGHCVDKGSKINILFTDGSRLELANEEDFNCKGDIVVYFGGSYSGKEDDLKELQTKKIETMRVWLNDSFVEKDFTKENTNEFFQIVNCLVK